MKKNHYILLLLTLFSVSVSTAQKTISFFTNDGVLVTADLYKVNDSLPYMILCHQAGSSRGEYLETAQRFTKFGYNCLAIDTRSGKEMNKIKNETVKNAKSKGRSTEYTDAEIDIRSAINYATNKNSKKVILVGSSYTASLVMKIAVNNPDVKAVIAFSPGEYFGANYSVKDSIQGLLKPLFVTSSKTEAPKVAELVSGVKSPKKQQFTPSNEGTHGSKTLWKETPNSKEYWTAIMMFMLSVK